MTLDRSTHLRLARTDPTGFVQDRAKPIMIDEVQRGGDPLALAIKLLLDGSQDKGQAVLAGSTRFLTEPRLSESLAGRVRFVEMGRLAERVVLETVLRLLAGRTASVLNAATLSDAARMSSDSMRRYLPLVETIFLSYLLPPFAGSTAARARRHPKIHMTDTGLAAFLLGLNADRLMDPDAAVSGALLESFVVMELVKQTTWSDEPVRLSYYRDHKERQVDIVVESQNGCVAGIEVTAAIDVDERDFRHLAYLRDQLGDRLRNGVVLHCGTEPLQWGDRLVPLPISAFGAPRSISRWARSKAIENGGPMVDVVRVGTQFSVLALGACPAVREPEENNVAVAAGEIASGAMFDGEPRARTA